MSLSDYSKKRMRDIIMIDEGFRERLYRDDKGHLTIGFGFNLEKQDLPISIALEWLDLILYNIEYQLSKTINFWNDLNDARKSVLISMSYQLGITGLINFRVMIKKLGSKDYVGAATEMKDSVWYREYTTRASRLVKIMISGVL